MKKIILFNFTDIFMIKVFKELNKKHEVVLYGNLNSDQEFEFKDKFLSEKKFFFKNAFKLETDFILTNNILKQFAELEVLFYKLSDRQFIKPISQNKKQSYFYQLLKYWISYFEKEKFDLLVFESHPHSPFDIIPFFIAKKKKIKIAILKSTSISNYMLLDTELHKENIYFEFKENSSENLNYIKEILSKKKIDQIETLSAKERRALELNKIKHIDLYKAPIKYLLSRLNLFKVFYMMKKKFKEIYFNLNFCEYLYEMILRDIQKAKLRRRISNISEVPDLKKKYVFFAFHYQPERSTDPQSDHYSNQLLPIKILNEVLPDDYVIYAKEHPRQLNDNFPDLRKKHFRDLAFYDEIKKLNKVKIVDIKFSSSALLENSKLNVSCTGTNVWEGILHFKTPGMYFGHSWASLCKSTPSVLNKDIEEIKNITLNLLSKDKQTVTNELNEFLEILSNYGIITSNVIPYEFTIPEDKMISNLVDSIDKITD